MICNLKYVKLCQRTFKWKQILCNTVLNRHYAYNKLVLLMRLGARLLLARHIQYIHTLQSRDSQQHTNITHTTLVNQTIRGTPSRLEVRLQLKWKPKQTPMDRPTRRTGDHVWLFDIAGWLENNAANDGWHGSRMCAYSVVNSASFGSVQSSIYEWEYWVNVWLSVNHAQWSRLSSTSTYCWAYVTFTFVYLTLTTCL